MYEDLKVLDVHSHLSAPALSSQKLMLMMAMNSPMSSPFSGGPGLNPIEPLVEEDYYKAAAGHVKYIDARDIDVQVVGPRPFQMFGWMQPHLLPAWTRIVNDMIAQMCRFFPERFLGAAQLPQDPNAADSAHMLPELNRVVSEYGFVATYVSPDPDGLRNTPGMHEAYWHPLYERCQELGLPIIVHGTNVADKRFAVVPHNYQLGFLTEQYLATQFLGHGDVFERYPELKVIVCHCGGALNRFIPTDHHLPQKDLSNNLFYDSCGYDLNFLEAAIKQRGVDQICFGVEAPGSGRDVRPETGRTGDDQIPVLKDFTWLSDDDRKKILHYNPAKVIPALGKV
jgi:predicted TIM-barrel fold metal-dependent hydrolase